MNSEDHHNSEDIGEMKVRRTILPDGRYLIYFDFPRTEREEQPKSSEALEPQNTHV